MRQGHCFHKGMDVGIRCWVSHFHVCKKFFQVLFLPSSVCHLEVLFGNLLPHLTVLVCCLDPGHGTSVNVENEGFLWYKICLLVG